MQEEELDAFNTGDNHITKKGYSKSSTPNLLLETWIPSAQTHIRTYSHAILFYPIMSLDPVVQ